jgi:hypothetical protein
MMEKRTRLKLGSRSGSLSAQLADRKKQSCRNIRSAIRNWGDLSKDSLQALRELTSEYRLSVASGHFHFLNGHWYITHAGLLRLAYVHKCAGIQTFLEKRLSDPMANRWVFKAVIYKTLDCRSFVAYGDADPSNVSQNVHGAELRIAETRAVNRALRKAYGVGICSVEELPFSTSPRPVADAPKVNGSINTTSAVNGRPRLRDQLCILIRQHSLDATLVKAYAADFCGTTTLSGASRELVKSFISHLSAAAKKNRDGLICKLNSYAQPPQVNQ